MGTTVRRNELSSEESQIEELSRFMQLTQPDDAHQSLAFADDAPLAVYEGVVGRLWFLGAAVLARPG